MSSAPTRFVVEAGLLVSLGVVLALADADPVVFAAMLLATVLLLAAVEGAVLQDGRRSRRGAGAAGEEEPSWASAAPVNVRRLEPEEAPAAAGRPDAVVPEELADTAAAAEAEPEEEPVSPQAAESTRAEETTAVVIPPATGETPAAETAVTDEPGPAEPAVPDAAPAQPAPPELELVARPEPEPEPELAREPSEPRSAVVELPARGPREWNLWDLERRARERSGEDPIQDEEWAALFVYLREHASPDGMLSPAFDDLVRESFAGLIGPGTR